MKLSADTDSPIFHDVARYISVVYLNGVPVFNVIEFDTGAGTLTRYTTDDDGELTVVDGLIKTEQLTGIITYTIHPNYLGSPRVADWRNDPRYR